MVGDTGFEPVTPCVSSKCATTAPIAPSLFNLTLQVECATPLTKPDIPWLLALNGIQAKSAFALECLRSQSA